MNKRTVLVIDDDEILREGVAVVLGREGYTVRKAKDAQEGLASLDCLMPDFILLDMMIPAPGRDGWHFLRELRKKPAAATVPVILITALGIASQEWAESLGAKCVIRKPFVVELLLAEIKRCLEP